MQIEFGMINVPNYNTTILRKIVFIPKKFFLLGGGGFRGVLKLTYFTKLQLQDFFFNLNGSDSDDNAFLGRNWWPRALDSERHETSHSIIQLKKS